MIEGSSSTDFFPPPFYFKQKKKKEPQTLFYGILSLFKNVHISFKGENSVYSKLFKIMEG